MRGSRDSRLVIVAAASAFLLAGVVLTVGFLRGSGSEQRRQIAERIGRAAEDEAQGRLATAQATLAEALAMADRVGDLGGQIAARLGLARLAAADERTDEALAHLRPARRMAADLKDPDRAAAVLTAIAGVLRLQGNPEAAKESLREALETPGITGEARAAALMVGGDIARGEGRYAEALGDYRQSQSLREKTGSAAGQAGTLAGIGAVCLAEGRPAEAIAWLERARSLAQTGAPLALPDVLISLGQAHAAAGRPDLALASLIEARNQLLRLGLGARAARLTTEIEDLRTTAPGGPGHRRAPPAPGRNG